jgi:hypothetical protein
LIPRQLKRLEEVPSEELAHTTKSGKTEMNVVAGYSVAKKNQRIFYGEGHHQF